MQIDVVAVRQHEFHLPQGIVRARSLAQAQLAGRKLLDDLRSWRERHRPVVLPGDDLHRMLLQVRRVLADARQQLGLHDAVRHVPIGAEFHELHVSREYRCARAREGAHDHIHRHHLCFAVLAGRKSEQPELGNVHDDGRRTQLRQPAPALQRKLDLPHPLRQRGHQFRIGAAAEHAVLLQAVAKLKPLQAFHQGFVERRAIDRGADRRGQIPEQDQQLPQLSRTGILSARLHGFSRQWRQQDRRLRRKPAIRRQ